MKLLRNFQRFPWMVLFFAYALIGLGLLNLYSSSQAASDPSIFYSQVLFVMCGTALVFLGGALFSSKNLEHSVFPFYVCVCLLLVAVDVMGYSAKGAERWIQLGPLRLQPSELAKIAVLLVVANSVSMALRKGYLKPQKTLSLWQLWPQAGLVGFPFILVLIQPDLGTSGLVLGVAAIQILLLPVRWWHLFVVTCFGLAAAFFAWNFVLYDYQKQRVFTFLDPTIDPQGSGYHTIQSMISIGHGGLWGQGFNQGTQSKLNFLPEPHTDFAFSVWAEEHGFAGAVVLIGVYFLLVASIFHLSRKFRNNSFATLTIVGIGAFFMLHGLINIGMVIGYLPVVGVPLTFFSYGGTHMISAFICLTILSILAKHRTV